MSNFRVFFFSTALSDEIYNSIVEECKTFRPTFSGVGFDRSVAAGLSEKIKVIGISLYPIPSYPKHKKVFKESSEYDLGNFHCIVPAMVNLPIIKELIFCRTVIKYVRKQLRPREKAAIVICGLYRSLLRPAGWLKKHLDLPVCAVVPDLPELMITYRKDYSKIRQLLNRIDVNKSKSYRKCVDGFVVLSKYMNPVVNPHNKPCVVVDGLFDIAAFPDKKFSVNEKPYILYAGKISTTFGVDKLVEAFKNANLGDVNLYLCGDGDYAPTLSKIASEDHRIQYLGTVSHDKVLEIEVNASLLVDPRPSDMEIVKMSFPSKIIEYMASGIPVLTTNLPCFGEEYRKYQYRINEETIDGIKIALQDVFSQSLSEREAMGEIAKQFILENKSISKQSEEILSLIERVVNRA